MTDRVVGVAAPRVILRDLNCKYILVSRAGYSAYISTRVGDGDVDHWIKPRKQKLSCLWSLLFLDSISLLFIYAQYLLFLLIISY